MAVALIAYIIYEFFSINQISVPMSVTTQHHAGPASPVEPLSPGRADFATYAEIFSKKDFFVSPYEQRIKNDLPPSESPGQSEAAILLENLKLVGIVLDEHPQAIVEDLRKKETLFLLIGDKIGDLVLSEIQPGKVIFLYGNQLMELTTK